MILSPLTPRQANVYQFLRDFCSERGYAPTIREVAEHFGISSTNGVMYHLRALERKGLIQRSPNRARAIDFLTTSDAVTAS